ncbi:MAG: response regulator [Dissulfurispiraceae bacterium]
MSDLPKSKVLVVQSHLASRNVITYILKQSGFKSIYSVSNGGEALKQLSSGEYGLIISDWQMPVMDGLSLLGEIRENPALKELVFVMVTAERTRDKVIEATERGVDGYLMKPFTADALCRKVVAALKTRHPEAYKMAEQQTAQTLAMKNKKKSTKTLGEAAQAGKNWSISLSHLSLKPQAVIKDDLAAVINIMSLQSANMKADSDFVSFGEMIGKVDAGIKNAEQQNKHATLIADAAHDVNQALAALENLPGGPLESQQGLDIINHSAVKLTEMVDSFDKDVADVMGMLSGIEHLVQQAHIHEINESIKESYILEVDPEAGAGVSRAEPPADAGKVAERLARIRTESESAREALTMAAGGITQVIERIKSPGPSARSSHEMFQQLSCKIDRIMNKLDSQIGLTEKLDTGVKEVAAVKTKISEPDEPTATGPAVTVASPREVVKPKHDGSPAHVDDKSALKKIWEYRILMIDIIKKEHGFSIKDLEGMLRDNEGCVQEHLPGHPACSFSKWIDHSLTQKDYYDPAMCQQLAGYRDDIYAHAVKAVELFRRGRKDEASKNYQQVTDLSHLIGKMLTKLQDDMRKKF